MQPVMTFERYEKKYRLTMSEYNGIRGLLEPYMREDSHGLHTISSVYHDTDHWDLIGRSIEKPVYKEKLRLRGYGQVSGDTPVYLELKKKLDGVVYKRRAAMPCKEAERYLETGVRPRERSQVLEEIDWFLRRYNPAPRVVISCDRIALADRRDGGFRVTFDFCPRWREDKLSLKAGSGGRLLLPRQLCLMELKTAGAIPVWMSEILSEMELYPHSFSKYGAFYKEQVLTGEELYDVG